MANSDLGEIRGMEDWEKLLKPEEMKQLIPFEIDEIIDIKGCRFKVRGIKEHPQNMITFEMLPKI